MRSQMGPMGGMGSEGPEGMMHNHPMGMMMVRAPARLLALALWVQVIEDAHTASPDPGSHQVGAGQ